MIKVFHSGDLGDTIAACPSFRYMGGVDLVMGIRGITKAITPARFETMRSLLEPQPYIRSVTYDHNPAGVTHDFSRFRETWGNGGTLIEKQARHFDIDEADLDLSPWIHVPNPIRSNKIVICRTHRYHGAFFPWDWIVNIHSKRIIFLGIEEDYQIFSRAYNCATPGRLTYVEFVPTPNAMEAARIIKGCHTFISNQTFLFWLALAVGAPRIIQESRDYDSTIPRAGIKYVRNRDDFTLDEVYKI